MALFSMFFFVSLYMQQVLGYDALKAGLSYLPLAVGIIVSAGVASQLVTQFGFKPVLIAGLVLTAGGLVWFAQISPQGTYVGDILFPSLLSAVGLGLAFVPMTIAAVAGVEPDEAGLASGLINTSQQVGGALGLAILAAIANGRTDDELAAAGGDPQALPAALTEGFQSALTVGAGFAIAGALLAMVLISGRASREHREAAQPGEPVPVAA
jgi:MFS family permease